MKKFDFKEIDTDGVVCCGVLLLLLVVGIGDFGFWSYLALFLLGILGIIIVILLLGGLFIGLMLHLGFKINFRTIKRNKNPDRLDKHLPTIFQILLDALD